MMLNRGFSSSQQLDPVELDGCAAVCLDAFLVMGLSSTLAYWATLFSRAPAFAFYPLFVICIIASFIVFRQTGGLVAPQMPPMTPLLSLFLLCIAAAAINIFTFRPDPDDFSYLHRALHAVDHPGDPLSLRDTAHDLTDLPPLSPVHLLSSLEVAEALIAHLLGLSAVSFAQMTVGTLVLFLLPVAYYSLFRALRFRVRHALWGSLGALVFLVLSGSSHQAWGNFTVVRIWQGKCTMIAVALPLVAAATIRFMLLGRKPDLVRLFALMVFGIGLTSSAFFVLPYLFCFLSGMICILGRFHSRLLRRFFMTCSVLAVPGVLAAVASSPFFLQLVNVDVWEWEGSAASLLGRIIGKPENIGIYLMIWLCCLISANKRTPRLSFLLHSLAAAIVLVLPLTSDLLLRVIRPAGFWRLGYTTLMPALAGFALAASISAGHRRLYRLLFCIACFFLLAIANRPALNAMTLHAPHVVKLPTEQILVSDAVAPKLPANARIAAPEPVVSVLALRHPEFRFLSTRTIETLHLVKNYRDQDEAARRAAAMVFLNENANSNSTMPIKRLVERDYPMPPGAPDAASLLPYLPKLDAIMLPASRDFSRLEDILNAGETRWKRETVGHGWNLWLKIPGNDPTRTSRQ